MANYTYTETLTPDQTGIANLTLNTWSAGVFYTSSSILVAGMRFTSGLADDSICESGTLSLRILNNAC